MCVLQVLQARPGMDLQAPQAPLGLVDHQDAPDMPEYEALLERKATVTPPSVWASHTMDRDTVVSSCLRVSAMRMIEWKNNQLSLEIHMKRFTADWLGN